MDVAWATLNNLILKASPKIFIVGRVVRGEVVPPLGGNGGLADDGKRLDSLSPRWTLHGPL